MLVHQRVWMTDSDPQKIVSQKIIDATQFGWNVHKMFFHVLSQITLWWTNIAIENGDL